MAFGIGTLEGPEEAGPGPGGLEGDMSMEGVRGDDYGPILPGKWCAWRCGVENAAAKGEVGVVAADTAMLFVTGRHVCKRAERPGWRCRV